jgi:hypothetical protein
LHAKTQMNRSDEGRLEHAKKLYSDLLLMVNTKMRKSCLELMAAAKERRDWGEAREAFIEAAQKDLRTYSE